MASEHVTLFLCGDVMLGRGVDQVLGHPGDSRLHESYASDARRYVELAEEANGPVPAPVEDAWPWGDSLAVLDVLNPDVRILNLETAVTRAAEFVPGKAVHYRMSPDNIGALTVARPAVCVLANNHVLDFGSPGLFETLEVLEAAGVRTTGAGRDLDTARRPAVVDSRQGGRVIVVALAATSSGVPDSWAAAADRPGVHLVDRLTTEAADAVTRRLHALRRPGDVVVASVHWGPNWGYDVTRDRVRFAHRLVDGGVDVVHGHSAHHPQPVEIYQDRLVLYGCGDFIDDYEGIAGYEKFRDDLRLMFLPTLDTANGRLLELRIAVMQARRLRLERAGRDDTTWMCELLRRLSEPHLRDLTTHADGFLTLLPRQAPGRSSRAFGAPSA